MQLHFCGGLRFRSEKVIGGELKVAKKRRYKQDCYNAL